MVEHLELAYSAETARDHVKSFQLKRTKARIGIGEDQEGAFPILRIPLKQGDVRWIGNLTMTLEDYDRISKEIVLRFEEPESDCVNALHISEIRKNNNVLSLGDRGKISWRHVGSRGRVYLYVTVPRDVIVCGVGRRQLLMAS